MREKLSNAAFNRAQAARARRLASAISHTHPDVARELESLADQFDDRAKLEPDEKDPS